MANINCTVSIIEADSLIEITGLSEDKLTINVSGDIDFTPLVLKLARLIDEECEITLINPIDDALSDKYKLVLKTVGSIFESYNTTIIEELEEVIEPDFLEEKDNDTQTSDDLPF